MRWLFLFLLAVGTGAVAYWWRAAPVTTGAPKFAMANMPQPVEVVSAERGRVEDQVDAVGSLTPNESANIAPEIAGRITALPFKEGQRVEAGQTLVELDASILQAELKQAEAELGLAEDTSQRTNELVKRGAGTVVAQQQASAQLIASQVKVSVARTRLEKTKLVAPFAGVIGLRNISVGNYVNVGQSIVTVTSVDPLKLNFRVPETYFPFVKTGQSVGVTVDARPNRRFDGEVYAIDPIIDENGRAITLHWQAG
jgi:membrane fusion protein (multidrug efflux system)